MIKPGDGKQTGGVLAGSGQGGNAANGGTGGGKDAGTHVDAGHGGSAADDEDAGSLPGDVGVGVDVGVVDNGPKCGDGKVALSEKCDIGIEAGKPGACPTECPPLADCVPRELSGSNCDAQCVLLEQLCNDDDGCCGSTCTPGNDNDCSADCGDGIVQSDKGETCEPGSADAPCPTIDDCDDHDPCTTDVLVGSETNCNAKCTNTPVMTSVNDDGCCLPGSNHNIDDDCTVKCGNGVREEGEECDGSLGCDENCKLTLTQDQLSCLDMLGSEPDPCDACMCMQCTKERLGCVASGNATRDMYCSAIIECANQNNCVGGPCLCLDTDIYPFCGGPCYDEIVAAAAAEPGGGTPASQTNDLDTAVGLANAASTCGVTNCADVCP